MERYVKQLIEDLEEICNQPIPLPFIEIPPEIQDIPEVAEYELGPTKSVSEWIGIDKRKFPEKHFLNCDMMEWLCHVMLKAFTTINVGIDLPDNIPPEAKYDLLLYCWDEPVPYISGPGFHIDFCTGNCEGCRIKEYCKSRVEYEKDEVKGNEA